MIEYWRTRVSNLFPLDLELQASQWESGHNRAYKCYTLAKKEEATVQTFWKSRLSYLKTFDVHFLIRKSFLFYGKEKLTKNRLG